MLKQLFVLAAPVALSMLIAVAPLCADGPRAYVPTLVPLTDVAPIVPDAAKETPGMVRVLLTINPSGSVAQAEALSGPAALRQPAIDAVRQRRYRPVIRDGQPVSAYTATIVNFMVEGKSLSEDLDTREEINASKRLSEIAKSLSRSSAQVLADLEQDAGGGDEMRRFYALREIAKAAFTAGAYDKAASYANELLVTARQARDNWNYGNAIHDANLVLGLLAARLGNVRAASQYLLDAGNTPGSPQLNSFGPDMSLAKALLEKGERDAVLEYFSRCRTFWKMGRERLDTWSEAVRAGGVPTFGFNAHMGN